MLSGSLCGVKNPDNLKNFNRYVEFLRNVEPELWRLIATTEIILCCKIMNCCINIKYAYGVNQVYYDSSED